MIGMIDTIDNTIGTGRTTGLAPTSPRLQSLKIVTTGAVATMIHNFRGGRMSMLSGSIGILTPAFLRQERARIRT